MKKNLSKLIIICILILTVLFVIFSKKKRKQGDRIVKMEQQDTTKTNPSGEEWTLTEPTKGVLAVVNNSKLTQDYLEERYEALPEQYKNLYINDKEGFLDQLIVRELFHQEAEKMGFGKGLTNVMDKEQRKDMAIEELTKNITGKIEISEEEMKNFYNDHISDMKGASYEQVKSNIKNHLMQQEQTELINNFIESLRKEAEIVKNEEWIMEQQALNPKNPLDEALKSAKPTVLDLGASSCVPCKMMKPIFAELEQEYKGKANILLLEIYEYKALANKYQIMVIPTQIFFDKEGNQFWRHEGFLAKDEIIKKLKELGVE